MRPHKTRNGSRLGCRFLFGVILVCVSIHTPASGQKVERPKPDVRREDTRTNRAASGAPKADVWDKGAKTRIAKPSVDVTRKIDSATQIQDARYSDATRAADTAKLDRDRKARAKAAPKADVWDRNAKPPVTEAPTSRAAQREAMRRENIPTSRPPDQQKSTKAGRQYEYAVPKEGGGTETRYVQRNIGVDRSHPGEVHVEAGRSKPNGQMDKLGRPRLQNSKTKVNVKPNGS